MEWNKNMKIQTKVSIGFAVLELVILFIMVHGFQTVSKMVGATDPEVIKADYRNVMFAMFILVILLMVGLSVGILGKMRKSFRQLSDVADKLALGEIDEITIVKDGNDEFGMLAGDVQQVVDSMKEQSHLAEEMATGNMMVDIRPKSD